MSDHKHEEKKSTPTPDTHNKTAPKEDTPKKN